MKKKKFYNLIGAGKYSEISEKEYKKVLRCWCKKEYWERMLEPGYGICTGGGSYWVVEERDDKD